MTTYRDYLKIGIMGGMGPTTSAAYYSRMIQLFQTEFNARRNFEFPEMVLHSIPSPDNVVAGVDHELLDYMVRGAALLAQAGMDFIVLPCNSAHVHYEALAQAAAVPVLNILEETARVVAAAGMRRVLVLGTKSTLDYNLYPPKLAAHGVDAVLPDAADREVLTRLIVAECEGSVGPTERATLAALIARYGDAEGVVLGCTELPLVLGDTPLPIPVFDTLEILVRAGFAYCTAPARAAAGT